MIEFFFGASMLAVLIGLVVLGLSAQAARRAPVVRGEIVQWYSCLRGAQVNGFAFEQETAARHLHALFQEQRFCARWRRFR
jgi:hypothetical protein